MVCWIDFQNAASITRPATLQLHITLLLAHKDSQRLDQNVQSLGLTNGRQVPYHIAFFHLACRRR